MIPQELQRKILLNPGPATTTYAVKYAQIVPDICPREKEFAEVTRQVRERLVKIVRGEDDYSCVLFTGSGTAGMDSVINSAVHDKKLLIINNGYYGERFAQIADAYGVNYSEMKFDMMGEIDVSEVKKGLMKKDIGYVAMVHHETTTGILNPVKEIGNLCKEHNKTFIVDTISSFAGVPFSASDYNIDFMMSTSNKCIQAMPGICFVMGKKSKIEKLKNKSKRAFYLDLYEQYKFFEKENTGQGIGGEQFRFTPAVNTMYSLKKAIEELENEGGVEARYNRYSKNYEILIGGLEKLGFRPTHRKEIHSKISTTMFEPEDVQIDFEKLHDDLYERGFIIYPNRVMYKGETSKVIRFANMGDLNPKDINNFLDNLYEILKQ